MLVFVTGATGWVGSAIVAELIGAGHRVLGLVRSEKNAQALIAAGGEPLRGELGDPGVLRRGAGIADGVIHTAFGLDLSRIVELSREDQQAIEAMGEALAGSDRPMLVTGGLGVGQHFTEETPAGPVNPAFPRASEQTAASLADRGVRASVVRLPRSVHGAGEVHGFVPQLGALALRTGVSAYIGAGANRWPAIHRLDAARVFRLALEHGDAIPRFHAVAEEGVAFGDIAAAIGRRLGVPTRSMSPAEGAAHFGGLAMFVGGDGPASNEMTRRELGWAPEQPGLIADIEQSYFA